MNKDWQFNIPQRPGPAKKCRAPLICFCLNNVEKHKLLSCIINHWWISPVFLTAAINLDTSWRLFQEPAKLYQLQTLSSCIQRLVSSHGPQYYYAAQCAAVNSIVPLLRVRTEREKQPGNGLNLNVDWLNLYCSGFVNYRKSDAVSRDIAAGIGNQAAGLVAEQSRQPHAEASAIFDAAGEGSRKTIALAPAINHRHEAGTEYRASYLRASIALRTAAIWRARIPVKCHL